MPVGKNWEVNGKSIQWMTSDPPTADLIWGFMGTSKRRGFFWPIPVAMALVIGIVAWQIFFLPSSLDEALFRYRLSGAAQAPQKKINFPELATFAWEEVCSHHPYDGDFKHPKYGRTYTAPMSAAHDGVWVLLFIDKDGGPTYGNL